jgi:hypothetical protein
MPDNKIPKFPANLLVARLRGSFTGCLSGSAIVTNAASAIESAMAADV